MNFRYISQSVFSLPMHLLFLYFLRKIVLCVKILVIVLEINLILYFYNKTLQEILFES